jgi:hypothetical protein
MPWIGDVPEEAPGAGLVLATHQGSPEHERNSERVLAGLVLRDLAQGDRKARMEMNGMQRKRNVGWLFLLTAVVVALSFAVPAHADLARVGPANVPSPPGNGFPFWYQDLKGLVLDLCLADNPDPGAAQQTACLLVTPPPYSFPTTFPDEAFYHRVVSAPMITDVATGKRAILVLALEAAFGSGVPQAGQQMVFTRIRVTAGVPFPGTYTINHPYGTDVQTVDSVAAGNRDIFFTIDTGLAPLNFTDALTSRVGPFIRASTAPGGAALPLVTINGAQFLGDGVALTKITGSPFGTDWFEMCGPFTGGADVCIRTEDFALTGRVHNGAIGSPLAVERATFARDAGGNVRIDVSATAAAGIGQNPPQLSVGGQDIPPHKMAGPVGVFNRFFVQDVPSPTLASTQVTVTNFADVPPTSVSTRLTDEVVVSSAAYDALAPGTLTVAATSSDKFGNPGTGVTNVLPTLTLDEFPDAVVSVVSNVTTFTVTPLAVPPPAVVVNSSGGGIGSLAVTITNTGTFGPGVVYAQDDIAAATAGSGPVVIDVLFNDTAPPDAPPIVPVVILAQPTLGTATANLDGTVSYSSVNSGTGTFKYTVANIVGTSNVATVTVDVAVNANATPIANPDSATVSAGSSVNISVLANDTGNGGTLNPASVAIVTVPARGSTLVNLTTGVITYTPTGATAGTDTFTYTVKNTNGNTSNAATVTVTITAAVVETIAVKPPVKCNNPNAWDMTGSSSITTGTSSVTIYNTALVPATPTASNVIGTATITAGKWQYRANGALPCKTPISIKSAGGAKQENIAVQIK